MIVVGGEEVLVGLGLTFNKAGNASSKGLVIKRMKPDSPAIHSKALSVGQCVVAIDGKPLSNIRNARDLAELTQVVCINFMHAHACANGMRIHVCSSIHLVYLLYTI